MRRSLRFAAAILLSLALHAALLSLLPRSGGERPRERRVMHVSLQAAPPPKAQPASSPQHAATPDPAPPKPKEQPRRPAPAPAAKPAATPAKPERPAPGETPREKPVDKEAPAGRDEPARASGSTEGAQPGPPEGASGENAAASQGPSGVVDVESLVVTKKILPAYPPISRKRKDQGTVTLLVEIEDGRVASARVERSSGHAPLDEAALRAVREWRFETPGYAGRIAARVPITFSLTK